jgi:ABC-type cobalamin/Fe3+-siderophores transport system ATPase subunit
MSFAISIENLRASYKNKIVLKEIILNIEEGSFLTILGPNGAGKTTLLHTILGIKRIDSGTIKIFGEKLNWRNIRKLRRKIGYVPQNIFIDPKFPISVYEIVLTGRIGLRFLKGLKKEDRKIAEWAMKRAGIIDLMDRPIGHLSGGELRKVFIARALCQRPEILLLDEPTSHLDPSSQKELINFLEELYLENKITTVFVTHQISHIPESCKEVIFMKEGSIVFRGKKEEGLEILKTQIIKNFSGKNYGISPV